MPQNDKIQLLYDDVKKDYEVGTLEDFKNYLSDDKKRTLFFNEVVKPNYEVKDISEFESIYELKKKVQAQVPTPTSPSFSQNVSDFYPQKSQSSGNVKAEKPKYGLRNDGTPKDKGYFGELKMKDGSGKVATEISIGVDFGKGEQEIPTLVPTLTPQEKDWLLKGNNPNDRSKIGEAIAEKAIKHAQERMAKGLPVFQDSKVDNAQKGALVPFSPIKVKQPSGEKDFIAPKITLPDLTKAPMKRYEKAYEGITARIDNNSKEFDKVSAEAEKQGKQLEGTIGKYENELKQASTVIQNELKAKYQGLIQAGNISVEEANLKLKEEYTKGFGVAEKEITRKYKPTLDNYNSLLDKRKTLGNSINSDIERAQLLSSSVGIIERNVKKQTVADYDSFKNLQMSGSAFIGSALAGVLPYATRFFNNELLTYGASRNLPKLVKIAVQNQDDASKSEFLQKLETKAKELGQKGAYFSNRITEKEGTVVDNFSNGNYTQAAKVAGLRFLESLPMMGVAVGLTALTGGTASSIIPGGFIFGAQNYYGEYADRTDMSETDKINASFLKGSLEMVTELSVLPLLSPLKSLIKTGGKEAAKAAVEKTLFGTIKNGYSKALPYFGWFQEGASEWANAVGSKVVDKLLDPKFQDKDWGEVLKEANLDGLEAFGPGAFGGGAITLTVAIGNTINKYQNKKMAREFASELEKIEQDIANPNLTDAQKDILIARKQEINGKLNDLFDADKEETAGATTEQLTALDDINDQQDEVTIALQDETITPESKLAFEAKAKELAEQELVVVDQIKANEIINKEKPKTKFYQGIDFMQQTGLRNGNYTEAQVAEARIGKINERLGKFADSEAKGEILADSNPKEKQNLLDEKKQLEEIVNETPKETETITTPSSDSSGEVPTLNNVETPLNDKGEVDLGKQLADKIEVKVDGGNSVGGEVKVFSQTDNKGRTFTYFSNTKEKDGIITTTFSFNRSDKDPSQRNNATLGIPVEKALGNKYTIDEDYIPEGAKVVGVSEIRVTDKGAAATVMFEADGQRFQGEVKLKEQSLKATPQAGSVGIGGDKIKLDPDLANIDPTLIAARNGDVEAQKQFEEMGLDWKQTTTYRFVGQSEVDVLLSNNKVESKRGMADAGIDVTSSPKVTTAATGEYRVTFKESFDKNNGLGKVRKKNEEDSNLERGRGYDINDVAKIERIDEKGNAVETIYEQSIKEAPEVEIKKVEAEPKENIDPERLRQIELLDTEKKIAQIEKEIRLAPRRGKRGVLSKAQLGRQLNNYKDQLRELKGLPPKKKVTDSVLRITQRKFANTVDISQLTFDEQLIFEAIGKLNANDRDIANLDGNKNLRKQGALVKQGGFSIDEIVTNFISENDLDADMAQDFRDTLIDFVNDGDAYEWMTKIKEREAQLDPDAAIENEPYNYFYDAAIENELSEEEINEKEEELRQYEIEVNEYYDSLSLEQLENITKDLNELEQIIIIENYGQKEKEGNVGKETDSQGNISESKTNDDEKTKSALETKVKEAKNAYQVAQNKLRNAKQAAERAGAEQQNNIFGGKPADALLFGTDLQSLNNKVKAIQAEADLAKENLDKAQLALDSFVPSNQVQLEIEPTEAAIVKDPILKRLNKAFLKIGAEILDNAEQLAAKAKELVSGGAKIDFSMEQAISQSKNVKLEYDSNGKHLAPNGKPSNLTEQQAKIVRTTAFKKWFGDWENDPKNASKIVDKNGEPMVVYHGTGSTLTEFDKNKRGSYTGASSAEKGFFVSDTKSIAESYRRAVQVENPNLEGLKTILSKLSVEELKQFGSGVMGYDIRLFDRGDYTKEEIEKELFRDIENDSEGYYSDRRKLIEKASKYLKENEIDFSPYENTGMLIEGFLNIKNPKKVDADSQTAFDIDLPKIIDNSVSENKDGVWVENVYDSVSFTEKGNDTEEGSIMVFFEPNQIKLADGTNTTFDSKVNDFRYNITLPDGSQKQVKAIDVDVVNGFYSPLEKVISEAKQDKMPAKQWAEKFAKGEEAKWTGLNEWLSQQQGSVSKEDIQKFLKENRIEIKEVVLGKDDYRNLPEYKDADNKAMDAALKIQEAQNKYWETNSDADFDALQDAKKELERWTEVKQSIERRKETEGVTKFSQYQLEGEKENYKEVLVTMPTERSKIAQRRSELAALDRERPLTESEQKEYDNLQQRWKKDEGVFKSPHYDELNILVHLRMNTRTDSEGNKVLFLEEVQSDWGQQGKKEGFSDAKTKQIRIDVRENEKGFYTVYEKGTNNIIADNYFTERAAREHYEARPKNIGTPTSPFVTDTNAWVKLGLKVALKEAVKQGADKIAWTTGEQQNDRYDLSKSYRMLSITPQTETDGYGRTEENGTYLIEGVPNKGDMSGGAAMAEIADNIPLDKIEDYVGKEIAEKVKQGQEEFEGNDLKVGGKGMKGFYGSPTEGSLGIVGNVAKSLFKQEPKTVDIETSKYESKAGYGKESDFEIVPEGERFLIRNKETKTALSMANSKQEAIDKIKAHVKTKSQSSTQHSIDITPELKSSVEQGQPLFHLNDKGEVLGFTHNGKIYLNGEKITAKTTMEEAGHIWINWAKENRSDLYQQGLDKVQGSKYLIEVNNNPSYQKEALKQGEKGSDAYNAYMQEEALAKAIADNGAKFITETKKAGFREWVNAMWKEVAKAFGIQNLKPSEVKALTLEQFARMAAADVFSNKEVAKPLSTNKISPNTSIQNTIDNANYTPRRKNSVMVRLPIDFVLDNQEEGYKVQRGQNEIGNRIDKAKEFLSKNPKDLEASDIYIKDSGKDKGKIGFSDGRHRLIAAKELGATHAYFEIPATKEQFDALNYLLSEFGNQKGIDQTELYSTQGDFSLIQTSDNTFLLNKGEDIYVAKLNESGGVDNLEVTKNGKKIKSDQSIEQAIQTHLQNINPESNTRNIEKFLGKSQNPQITEAINATLKGEMNADDAAIALDEKGIEVTNEIYDSLRDAEKQFQKEKAGIQVGDIVMVKGRNGNPNFEANFRGLDKNGKYIVYNTESGTTFSITKDEIITPISKEAELADLKEQLKKARTTPTKRQIQARIDELEGNEPKAPRGPSDGLGSRTAANTNNITPTQNAERVSMKFHLELKKLIESIGVPIAERNLSKRFLGIFKHRSMNIRVQSLFGVATAAHETAHWVSKKFGIGEALRDKSAIVAANPDAQLNKDLRKALTEIYIEFYPNAKKEHSLRLRVEEGIAVLLEHYLTDPTDIANRYGILVDNFIAPTGKYYHPKFTELLDKLNKFLSEYSALTANEKIGSRIVSGEEVTKKNEGFTPAQSIVNGWVNSGEPLRRADNIADAGLTQESAEVAHLRWLSRAGIIAPWITGEKHALTLGSNGNWKEVGASVKDYLELIKGREIEFNEYLVARRNLGDVNYLTEMENELADILADIENEEDLTKEEVEEINELSERIEKQKKIIKNDNFKIQETTETVRMFEDEFKKAVAIYDKLNNAVVDFAQKSGLLSQETAEAYKANTTYTSFKRLIHDDISSIVLAPGSSSQSQVDAFKTRTGSDLAIIDPVYSQIQFISETLNKGMQNMIWQRLAALGDTNPELAARFEKVETIIDVDPISGKISYPQMGKKEFIMVKTNGKPKFYLPAPEYVALAETLTPKELETMAYVLTKASGLFSRLTTSANPLFPLVNIPIDTISAWMNTKTGFIPIWSQMRVIPQMASYAKDKAAYSVKNLANRAIDFLHNMVIIGDWFSGIKNIPIKDLSLEEQNLFAKYLALGGSTQTLSAYQNMSPEEMIKAITGQSKFKKVFNKIIDLPLSILEMPSNASEYMTRFAEFKRAKDQGYSDDIAMYMAAHVSVPFIQSGTYGGQVGKTAVKAIPYFHSSIQVLAKFAQTAKNNPTRTATIGAALIAIKISQTLLTMALSDDEDKEMLAEQEPSELAKYIYVPNKLFGGKGFTRIRFGNEFGSISAPIEMMILQNKGLAKYNYKDYLDATTTAVPAQFNLFKPVEFAFSYTPQLVRPTLEVGFNVKTYPNVRPIVPYGVSFKSPMNQYNQYTTETSKYLGQLAGLSPMKIDYFVKAQFGKVPDMLIRNVEKIAFDKKDKSRSQIFLQEEQYVLSGRNYVDFYEKNKYWQQLYNDIRLSKNTDVELTNEQLEIIQNHKIFDATSNVLAELRERVNKGEELSRETKHAAFELLKELNASDKPYTLVNEYTNLIDQLNK